MMKHSILVLAALGLLFGGAGSASATNLIVNGGFETGDLTGWSGGGNFVSTGIGGQTAHSGNWFLAFGAVGGDASTSQMVTTMGEAYDLQFFYSHANGAGFYDMNVYWDGVLVFSEVNQPGAHGWQQHDIIVTGTGSDTVTFAGRNDPSWDGIDDVSLNAVGPAAPEPASLTMLGIGAFGLLGYAWRRKRAATKLNLSPQASA